MNQETLEKMRQMHLYGMSNAFKTSMDSFKTDSMTTDQFISWLVTSEWDDRCNRMIERLADLSFIKDARSLFITGSAGTGKSYIASALGYQACQKGLRVLYWSTSKLMGSLKSSKLKGTYINELKKIERADLLILDDFGIQPFDSKDRSILMDIVEDRYEKKSTLITSQVPVEGWCDIIGDQTIADAVLDRIVHTAVKIELFGESLRKLQNQKKM